MPWLDIWRIEAKEIALNLIEIYSKTDEKAEILDTDEISLDGLEPKTKKVKLNEEEKFAEEEKLVKEEKLATEQKEEKFPKDEKFTLEENGEIKN